jgi:hypothetical protein
MLIYKNSKFIYSKRWFLTEILPLHLISNLVLYVLLARDWTSNVCPCIHMYWRCSWHACVSFFRFPRNKTHVVSHEWQDSDSCNISRVTRFSNLYRLASSDCFLDIDKTGMVYATSRLSRKAMAPRRSRQWLFRTSAMVRDHEKIGARMAGISWKTAAWAQVLFCQVNYEKLLEIDIIFICHNF